jgi:glycerol-3-phosphate acyltransferase PlsX
MGEAYAKMALGIERPRIAQLNIGSEEAKGTGMVKAVREMLGTLPGINYTGYIEGRDVFEGAADVIVTDGFVGNTMLKLAEGMARSFFKAIAQEVFEADMELAIKLGPVVEGLKKKNDYHEYGGAPLLGVNGGCIICHGSSERRTIKNAVRAACELVRSGVNQQIIERVAAIDEMAGRGVLAD